MDELNKNFITRDKKKWYSAEYIERNYVKKSDAKKENKSGFISKEEVTGRYFSKAEVRKLIAKHIEDNRKLSKGTDKTVLKEKYQGLVKEDKAILEDINNL